MALWEACRHIAQLRLRSSHDESEFINHGQCSYVDDARTQNPNWEIQLTLKYTVM